MRPGKRTVVEVGALTPLDGKAARVLGGGVHWTPELARHNDPSFVREEEGALKARRGNHTNFDISGQRFGQLVVMGLGPKRPNSKCGKRKAAVWVVRCDCGAYEHRRVRSLREGTEDDLCCSHCFYLKQVKRGLHPQVGPFNKADQPPPE